MFFSQTWTESGTAGSPYPELVLTVLGPLVERPVVVETADVVYAVEALDPLRHALQLRHIGDVRHRGDRIDLQIWRPSVKEVTQRDGHTHRGGTAGGTFRGNADGLSL